MGPSAGELDVRRLQLQAALKAHAADRASKPLLSAWRAACVAVQQYLPALGTVAREQLQALVALLQLCGRSAARLADGQNSVVLPQATLQYQVLRHLHAAQLHQHVPALGTALLEFIEQHEQHVPQTQVGTLRSGAFAALAAALPHVEDAAAVFAPLAALCMRALPESPPQPAWPLAQRLIVTRCQATASRGAAELDASETHMAMQLLAASLHEHAAAVTRMLPGVARAASTAALEQLCCDAHSDTVAAVRRASLPHLLAELSKVERVTQASSAVSGSSECAAVLHAHRSVWAASHGVAACELAAGDTRGENTCPHSAELLAAVVASCTAAFGSAGKRGPVASLAAAVPCAASLAKALLSQPPPLSQPSAARSAALALGAALAASAGAACAHGLSEPASAFARGAALLLEQSLAELEKSADGSGADSAAYVTALRCASQQRS